MLTPKEILNELKPCHYKYNDIKDLGDKVNFGFLAQDLLDSFGDEYNFVTKEDGDDYFKVNYYQFISILVSVVKEQQVEINKLKNKGNL